MASSAGARWALFYLVLSVATGLLLWHLPGAFLPDEDQGMLNALVKLPAGSTLEQTRAVMDRLSAAAVKDDSVLSIQATAGFSVTGSGQNVGQAFIRLKDWDDRKDDADTIAARLTAAMASVPDAQVFITSPPAILGLGDAGGFTLELQDEGGAGHAAAVAARNTLLKEAAKDPKLVNVRYASLEDAPVYAVKVDDAKAQAMGVNPQDINDTLNAALGGDFVNNFIYKGRIKKVFIQGTAEARMQPQDIERWSVRNQAGQMVPLSSLVSAHWTSAPAALQRYNGVSAMEITGQPAPGVSSGEAMAEIARLADTLPEGFSHAWSDMAYQEQLSGNQAPMLYAISLLFVFLCLAALYESWAVPFAVMLAVPVGVFGAVLMMNLRGLNNDVYFQVGLLTTIGLAAKNGILIVEFARILEQQGRSTRDAILQAVYLRLRPIVMTSLAFLMGVLPLVFATGAGSAARRSLGTGVAGGTVASMVLGMFFVPLFYLLVRRLFPGRAPADATARRQAHEADAAARPGGRNDDHRAGRLREHGPALPAARGAGAGTVRQCRHRRGRAGTGDAGLARGVPGTAPAAGDRAGAAEQPRPARGGAAGGEGARAVPHPARGAAAVGGCQRQRHPFAGERCQQRDRRHPGDRIRCRAGRHQQLGAGPVRAHPQPEERGAAELAGQRREPARRAPAWWPKWPRPGWRWRPTSSRWHSRNRRWTASSRPCSAPRPAMHRAGLGLDLSQVQTSVEAARGALAKLQTQQAQDRDALQLLVGRRWIRPCCRPRRRWRAAWHWRRCRPTCLQRAAAAPGRAVRRARAAGGQRRYRCRARRVLPDAGADRQLRPQLHRVVDAVLGRHPWLVVRAQHHRADLPCRRTEGLAGCLEDRQGHRHRAVREGDPAGLQ
jgi:uncharacterized membrane protein